jgi:hypothetical protein
VKGAVLQALASLARSSTSDYIIFIWNEMEFPYCDLLDYVRKEYSNFERKNNRYPLTDGFITLLTCLLEHAIPYYSDGKLGSGSRLPGILRYLDFIVDDIIAKTVDDMLSYDEDYSEESFDQQYRLLDRSLICL